jgi:hypothetical protein
VDISITLGTSKRLGVGRISQIEEIKSRGAVGVVTRLSTNGDTVLELLVDNNVMSATHGKKSGEVAGEVLLSVEDDRILGVDL